MNFPINCPKCRKSVGNIICNDGGSIFCEYCRTKFHYCDENQVKYNSPGPLMCKNCKNSHLLNYLTSVEFLENSY